MPQTEQLTTRRIWPDLALGMALATAISLALWPHHQAPQVLGAAVLAQLALSVLILSAWRGELPNFGWANRVTLLRAAMITALAGIALTPLFRQAGWEGTLWPLSLLALLALLLDGVDGWVARRTRSLTRFGARFDMELDAFLMLLLCVALITHDKAGPWVLALGGMRYAFVAAGARWAWLRAPLPESLRRKTICVIQVGALIIACTPFTPPALATPMLAIALILLSGSFLRDILWLYHQARGT
ncbi:CDP-alcohol phosphatidyltransferase family protein [Halomonas sp. 18H]|uniref:CDP-alcohol phosphatidyltransferase family protein n=1 Tax=Halomonas almeriensis TaxID=308163 RepID=UPI00222FCA66|nr:MULTISPECIES: CDP-alcohol phosphatidyltransferase family protein [Halomonas]MCW4153045.1 CDP-alcohol phosphatidyltransferase family protein [Halomonas sp. 18H]MDN3554264.1 CDP-alcohol phosphatidyltransferase family protein [Halomonas almeriensis]